MSENELIIYIFVYCNVFLNYYILILNYCIYGIGLVIEVFDV